MKTENMAISPKDTPRAAPCPRDGRSALARAGFVCAGGLALALGILGIFLPLLPTTPFVLLAAACFMRSSARLHAWLSNHRWFGLYLQRYQRGEGIPRRARNFGLLMLWGSSLASAASFWYGERIELLWIPPLAVALGSYFMLRIPTSAAKTR